jgi:peptidoglycan/LPS O-acetylase OafA/YrhL
MNDALYYGTLALAGTGFLLLGLAWRIGVHGDLALISNYRAHPERYPDGPALGRWMAWTLALGGVSFLLCAIAVFAGEIGPQVMGPWAGATGAFLGLAALAGLARYRRKPPPGLAATGHRRR